MKLSRLVLCVVCGLALGVTTVAAKTDLENWQFKKVITISPEGASGYYNIRIDGDVYAKSPTLRDLRIIDTKNEEVPFQQVVRTARAEQDSYPVIILDSSTQNGQTMFVADSSSGRLVHDQILINTPSKNFKRQVSVYASDTLRGHQDAGWRLLTDKGYIYNHTDVQAGIDIGSGLVSYPRSTSRYLRIVIGGVGEQPITVYDAHVSRYDLEPGENETKTVQLNINENAEDNTTEISIDKGSPGIPTHEVALTSTGTNFNRRAIIESSSDGIEWNRIGQDYLFVVNTSLFTGTHLTTRFPETKDRYIRVIVFNEDNRPIPFGAQATIEGTVRSLVFEAQSGQKYFLYYGNPGAEVPRYDLARLFQYIETTNLPQATLGQEMDNESYSAPMVALGSVSERMPYLLNIVLVLLVVVIGLVLFSYIKKINKENKVE